MDDASDIPIDEQPATAEETRADLLGGQHRRGAPIRSSFLQERGGNRAPGPLHRFVQQRQLFTLHLYLLLHCIARAAPWDAWLPSAAWARALDKTGPGAEASVSRAWGWLRKNHLVESKRDRRILRLFLRREDGSNEAYLREPPYFSLPLAFFLEGWHKELTLPATAVLLIALDRSRTRHWFELRTEHAAEWFGISADTLQRGLDELRDNGLLEVRQRQVKNPRARYGVTAVNNYRLVGSFAVNRVIDAEPAKSGRQDT